jgi:hypothetical protein
MYLTKLKETGNRSLPSKLDFSILYMSYCGQVETKMKLAKPISV